MSLAAEALAAAGPGLRAVGPISPEARRRVRRSAIFECGKWDPRVGDTDVLAPWALVLESATWRQLGRQAEGLAAETLAIEGALLSRPDLWGRLGLPRPIRRALAGASSRPVHGPRLMRFDFHPTPDGWRISEVNSDVPGGFIEAGGFTRLMAGELGASDAVPPDPARAVAKALCRAAEGREGVIALVHATAYSDDRSVVECLGREIRALGREACAAAPDHLAWADDGTARLLGTDRPVAAIHRFFPGEWLANLPRRAGWERFFGGSPIPQTNPATALLTQTKRHPLCWEELGLSLPLWRELLPNTAEPREALRSGLEGWVLKPAWGRVGDGILMGGVTPEKEARKLRWSSRLFPREWIAQRRFQPTAIPSPVGPIYPCLGVYVVEGRASGIYARASARPLIGDTAWDVAVLIEQNDSRFMGGASC